MINVTKTYLPDIGLYNSILKRAWDKSWVTNNGELVQELEAKLKDFLGVNNLLFTNNGTMPLQMALKGLKITGEVITTPFSYVATTTAILWEGCKPVFVDINPDTFCIDPEKIVAAITPKTQAILATHVYGIPCDTDAIENIAKEHGLKVIYDGAHSFGVKHNGRALLSYGDVSTCSFHATKLFHTVEGGCLIAHDEELAHELMLYRQFGHVFDDYYSIGTNAKNSEFHAAMGLAILPDIEMIINDRRKTSEIYDLALSGKMKRPVMQPGLEYNYSYYPIVFENEETLLKVVAILKSQDINSRRYFYPSLNQLPYVKGAPCPVSEYISKQVLCLPLYYGLEKPDVDRIIDLILKII